MQEGVGLLDTGVMPMFMIIALDIFITMRFSINCSVVWPTRLIFLAMGEVLSFGFNLVVLDPSNSRGNDTYCIVAIEDKKMGFISYCLSLSLYIMSSYLMCYSALMNLIL